MSFFSFSYNFIFNKALDYFIYKISFLEVVKRMEENGFIIRWGGVLFLTSLSYFMFRLHQQRAFFRQNVEKYKLVS